MLILYLACLALPGVQFAINVFCLLSLVRYFICLQHTGCFVELRFCHCNEYNEYECIAISMRTLKNCDPLIAMTAKYIAI